MRLSADAKRHVASQVTAAFAGRIKELTEAKTAAKAEENVFYDKVEAAVEKFKREVVFPKFRKLVESLGRFSDKIDADDPSCSLAFGWSNSGPRFGKCDFGTDYADTIEAFAGVGDKYKAAREALDDLEAEVKTRVDYALFEIEVHGKKDTLDAIVREAIDIELEKIGGKK